MIFFRIYKTLSKFDENLEMIDRRKCEEANASDGGIEVVVKKQKKLLERILI